VSVTSADGTLSLAITGVASADAGLPDLWRITWSLTNLGADRLEILETWLPHDQFRAGRESFEPPLALAPRASTVLVSTVESPLGLSETIENAFLILRTRSSGRNRRVFARLRVEHEGDGRIRPVIESLTTTKAGVVPGRADLTSGP